MSRTSGPSILFQTLQSESSSQLHMILPLLHVTLYFGETLECTGVEGQQVGTPLMQLFISSHLHCREIFWCKSALESLVPVSILVFVLISKPSK